VVSVAASSSARDELRHRWRSGRFPDLSWRIDLERTGRASPAEPRSEDECRLVVCEPACYVGETSLSEDLVSSRRVYNGRVVSLRVDQVRLPSGRVTEREIVEHGGAVGIVAVDDDGQVLLVRQFRSALGTMLLEIPAGTLDPNEDVRACAFRELQEETGYAAREMRELYAFYSSPGFSNERISLFLATGLSEGAQRPETDEIIEVVKMPLDRVLEMVAAGEICDGKSILGLIAGQARLSRS
jgi:ADP-ribose pyrophosphatase